MSDGFIDGFFGNLIKEDTLWFFDTADQSHVPSDSLTFTVGVGSQKNLATFLDERFEFVDEGFFARCDHIAGNKASFDIDSILVGFWEITHMSNRSDNLIFALQVFFNGFCFGWRFNDEKFHNMVNSIQ